MSSSITSFKNAIMRNKGFARPNRFHIEITAVPNGSDINTRDLAFLCESVNLPGKQITTTDYEIGTRRALKIPTGYIEDDVTMTFNLTNNYLVKNAIDSWMKSIINIDSYLLEANEAVYKKDINISQLDENDKSVYKVRLEKAFPITLNSIELDANTESAVQKVTVVFTYDKLVIL